MVQKVKRRTAKQVHDADLQQHKARKAKVEADLLEGKVVDRRIAEQELSRILATLKRRLRGVPGTVSAQVADTGPAHMEAMSDAIDQALRDAYKELTTGKAPAKDS